MFIKLVWKELLIVYIVIEFVKSTSMPLKSKICGALLFHDRYSDTTFSNRSQQTASWGLFIGSLGV